VAVRPGFDENGLVYFTYLKPDPDETISLEADARPELSGTSVLTRGRFDGAHKLTDVEDVFVSNVWTDGFSVARLVFAPDGKIFISVGIPLRD